MTYRLQGLSAEPFRPLFSLNDQELADRRARRVTASGPGFACRVSLEDAQPGEELILLNYISQDAETPFRTAYGIYVRQGAGEPAVFEDELPPMLDKRILSLRGFDRDGMLRDASLATPGESDREVRLLLDRPEIASIHAHSAAHGCFLARIERS